MKLIGCIIIIIIMEEVTRDIALSLHCYLFMTLLALLVSASSHWALKHTHTEGQSV